jgi:hypothetical protein
MHSMRTQNLFSHGLFAKFISTTFTQQNMLISEDSYILLLLYIKYLINIAVIIPLQQLPSLYYVSSTHFASHAAVFDQFQSPFLSLPS